MTPLFFLDRDKKKRPVELPNAQILMCRQSVEENRKRLDLRFPACAARKSLPLAKRKLIPSYVLTVLNSALKNSFFFLRRIALRLIEQHTQPLLIGLRLLTCPLSFESGRRPLRPHFRFAVGIPSFRILKPTLRFQVSEIKNGTFNADRNISALAEAE